MADNLVSVSGMIISSMPVGEYDRRVVLLTREKGKITAFAKAARRLNSPLSAGTQPFVFGEFELYEGRTSYNIRNVSPKNYFLELVSDFYGVYYGFYFLEMADYYGREGNDESASVNLLYQSFRALLNKNILNELVKVIFEIKIMEINGEYPEFFNCSGCKSTENISFYSSYLNSVLCENCRSKSKDSFRISQSAVYALQYIISAPVGKLYNFTVTEEVLKEMKMVISRFRNKYIDKKMKSLEILETISIQNIG